MLCLHFGVLAHEHHNFEYLTLRRISTLKETEAGPGYLEFLILTSSEIADLRLEAVDLALQEISPSDIFLEGLRQ